MTWFIIQTERKTWTKYLVEAADEEAAVDSTDNAEYLGYLDGDDTDHDILGPFRTREEALIDVGSYVDGD